MNATEIEDRLHELISEAETSGYPIDQIELDSGCPGDPYIALRFSDHRKVIILHPEDWKKLVTNYDIWTPGALGKSFFRGIPVYLTDQPQAASLSTMIKNDARIKDVFNVLNGAYLDRWRAEDAARDVIRVLNLPRDVDWVGVAFCAFASPAEAAAWANGIRKIYTYYAPQRMKLTIGDVVIVEDGSRPATVVELNAPHDKEARYKKVLKRNE